MPILLEPFNIVAFLFVHATVFRFMAFSVAGHRPLTLSYGRGLQLCRFQEHVEEVETAQVLEGAARAVAVILGRHVLGSS